MSHSVSLPVRPSPDTESRFSASGFPNMIGHRALEEGIGLSLIKDNVRKVKKSNFLGLPVPFYPDFAGNETSEERGFRLPDIDFRRYGQL